MGRISEDTRARNEEAIRAAMDRLLRGDLPPGGKCDLRTLASEAGVPRTAFYTKKNRDGTTRPGPYQHLAQEFERRLTALRDAGSVPDSRAAQIERLKEANTALKSRLGQRDAELETLKDFKRRALSQIAAQHLEIERLREQAAAVGNIRRLPSSRSGTAPYGSCS
jgi:DNA repair exonuclease SbcCD ATPase subunit